MPREETFRRSSCLAFWFRDGRLRCKNYLTGIEVAVAVAASARLVDVLASLDRWRTFAAIVRRLPGYSPRSIRDTLGKLISHTLVVSRGSRAAERERALDPWRVWGEEAALFHFATKDAHEAGAVADELRFTRGLLRRAPMPAAVKRYPGAPRVRLPAVDRPALEQRWPRVLLARRTVRRFGRAPLTIDQLSTLLYLTWGVTGTIRWPGLGRVPVKTSPSGGARHSLEVYVFARHVAGLAPGLYHYRGDRHSLERLRRGCRPADLARLAARQKWVGKCAALCVMTSVFPRVMWRYKFSRAYRVILLEAGHVGQTFALVATWLGLAPFTTAALLDNDLEQTLGIDGASESVVYGVGVGTKSPGS
jgi:SagB-type dehydrogenase family enzyme